MKMVKNYEFLPNFIVTHENGNSINLKVPEITFLSDHILLSEEIIPHLHHCFENKIPPEYFHIPNQFNNFESSFSANVVLSENDSDGSWLKITILEGVNKGKFRVKCVNNEVKILMGALLMNNLNNIIEEINGDQDIPGKFGKKGNCEFSYYVDLAEVKNSKK
jgi:hypothetical protein